MTEAPIPVLVLTGFLGSGKTTLLSRLLRDPRFGRTAVVINEFGDIGLDHDLVESSDERLVQLTTGCLCCAARGDLADTLLDLWARREAGTVPRFTRAVVETSGLADPAPVLHALMADAATAARFALHSVVTLVDAVHGAAALAHGEAQRQVAAADHVLLSKTDAAVPAPTLLATLAALNPGVPPCTTADTDLVAILDGPPALRLPPDLPPARHTPGLGAVTVLRERSVPGAALALWLQALAAHAGPRLLRVKGLVDVEEAPGRPAVIHGVQHVFAAPEWLLDWPGSDHRTRLVVIGRDIPPYWPSRLLDVIEAEVRDEARLVGGYALP